MATNIKNNLTKDEIKTLQSALMDQGYDLGSYGADGIWGSKTQAAVDQYYNDNGAKTWKNGGISQEGYDNITGKSNSWSTRNTTTTTKTTSQPSYVSKYNDLMSQLQSTAGTMPTYSSEWDQKANDLSNAYLNVNYNDYLNGQEYQDLAKQYQYAGNQAMKDTLGQVSARTGGLASSYATTASQQAYNDYMNKLSEAAAVAYDNQRQDALNNAELAITNAQNDYDKYLNEMDLYNNNYKNQYNLLSDAITMQQQEDQLANEYKIAQLQAAAQQTGTNLSNDVGIKLKDELTVTDYDSLFQLASASSSPTAYIRTHYKEAGFNNADDAVEEYDTWISQAGNKYKYSASQNGYSNFNAAMTQAAQALSTGNEQTAINVLNQIWDKLSRTQQEKLIEIYGKYGYDIETA